MLVDKRLFAIIYYVHLFINACIIAGMRHSLKMSIEEPIQPCAFVERLFGSVHGADQSMRKGFPILR